MNNGFIQRLKRVLGHYGFNPSQFADKVGVQRSSVSHVLSGRNRPSLDFVMKVMAAFPEVDLYWLLNGKGSFPTPAEQQSHKPHSNETVVTKENIQSHGKEVKRIVIFYQDGTFEIYNPS